MERQFNQFHPCFMFGNFGGRGPDVDSQSTITSTSNRPNQQTNESAALNNGSSHEEERMTRGMKRKLKSENASSNSLPGHQIEPLWISLLDDEESTDNSNSCGGPRQNCPLNRDKQSRLPLDYPEQMDCSVVIVDDVDPECSLVDTKSTNVDVSNSKLHVLEIVTQQDCDHPSSSVETSSCPLAILESDDDVVCLSTCTKSHSVPVPPTTVSSEPIIGLGSVSSCTEVIPLSPSSVVDKAIGKGNASDPIVIISSGNNSTGSFKTVPEIVILEIPEVMVVEKVSKSVDESQKGKSTSTLNRDEDCIRIGSVDISILKTVQNPDVVIQKIDKMVFEPYGSASNSRQDAPDQRTCSSRKGVTDQKTCDNQKTAKNEANSSNKQLAAQVIFSKQQMAPPQASCIKRQMAPPQASCINRQMAPPQASCIKRQMAPPQASCIKRQMAPPQASCSKQVVTPSATVSIQEVDFSRNSPSVVCVYMEHTQPPHGHGGVQGPSCSQNNSNHNQALQVPEHIAHRLNNRCLNVDASNGHLQLPNISTPIFSRGLRPVAIDGSNVAFNHGKDKRFSCKGIALCIDYFLKLGHEVVKAFVPQFRRQSDGQVVDVDLLEKLGRQQYVVFTPSRKINGRNIICHDDRFILEYAHKTGAVIVSNDNYRDMVRETPAWREMVVERLLMFAFADDIFMVPQDPHGRHGPSLKQLLSF